MQKKGIYIFIGPPYSGKETQTVPLTHKLGIPVISMGLLIRQARQDPKIEAAFQRYAARGHNIPIGVKFPLLEEKMDKAENGFILDNFPGTADDLFALNKYLEKRGLEVEKVFYLKIGNEEMFRRFEENPDRGRADDNVETLKARADFQSKDREAVIQYYKNLGKLVEIDGENSVQDVSQKIHKEIKNI